MRSMIRNCGKTLINEWALNEIPHYPKRSAWSVEYQQFGFAMTMGGGFDAVFGRAFAWRVLDVRVFALLAASG